MKIHNTLWFLIAVLWIYAIFTNNHLLSFIAVPFLIGLFFIMNSKEQVEDMNSFYIKMSKRSPILFPPVLLEKTSYKFQRWFALLIGILLVLSAIIQLIELM